MSSSAAGSDVYPPPNLSARIQQPPAILPPDAPTLPSIAPSEIGKWRQSWARFVFGGAPPPVRRPPLNVRIDRREECNGIERFHLLYDVEPGVTTEAYLLRLKDAPGRRPGVVVFHQTTTETIGQSGSLDPASPFPMALHLAKRGYVVIAPKCYLWGASGVVLSISSGAALWAGEVEKMRQRHPAWKGMARMIWDGMRALDLLASRADVDPARIGCIGHSLGAKEALFLAAFDPRVKAAVSSDGGIGLTFSNWDAPWYLGPEIRAPGFALENHQALALIAPRAFLLVAGQADNERSWPFVAGALKLWQALGAPDAVGWFRHHAGHTWPPEAQQAGYAFIDHFLKH